MRALSPLTAALEREDLERGRVGHGDHVGLVDPGEALDGRAVEADALVERGLQLGRRHRHALERAEHVGEPQPDEPDVALLQRPEHELLLTVHAVTPIAHWTSLHRVLLRGTIRDAYAGIPARRSRDARLTSSFGTRPLPRICAALLSSWDILQASPSSGNRAGPHHRVPDGADRARAARNRPGGGIAVENRCARRQPRSRRRASGRPSHRRRRRSSRRHRRRPSAALVTTGPGQRATGGAMAPAAVRPRSDCRTSDGGAGAAPVAMAVGAANLALGSEDASDARGRARAAARPRREGPARARSAPPRPTAAG